MKFLFKIILFLIFFQIALFFVAYTNFFPNTIYGDVTHYGDLSDPDNLPNAETMFNRIVLNAGEEAYLVDVGPIQYNLTWGDLMIGIVAITIAVGALTRSPVLVTLLLICTMFLFMYNNSKDSIQGITENMHVSVQYFVLMIAVGVLVVIVLTIMDYAAGQRSSGG